MISTRDHYAAIREISPMRRIVEIGCEKMGDTERLRGYFPDTLIHCFEVDPRSIDYVLQNRLPERFGVTFHPHGLSDSRGTKQLFQSTLGPDEWYPQGGCWLYPNDQAIHAKSKNTSLIYSDKQWTYGHSLRHEAVRRFGDRFDHSNRVPYKLTHLQDYRFHLTIENSRVEGYFTEKIIDAFRAGCIPIYWGDPAIGNHFDMDGIIVLPTNDEMDGYVCHTSLDALGPILDMATPAFYESKIEAVRRNFEKAKQFCVPEDWLWEHVLSKMGVFK